MELHQLRYFVAVAETGNFTRAAERCFVAQPSLSQQIQKLERLVKKPLFDRLGKRVKLTEAGETLLGRARAILAQVDETSRALSEDAGPGHGTLSLGVIPTIAPFLLPAALPRIRLTLLVGMHAQAYFLGRRRKKSLAQTVRAWREYLPEFFPLPHPSPRNRLWMKNNPWFVKEVLPALRRRVRAL